MPNLFKAFTASLLVALSASVLLPPVVSAQGQRKPRAKRPVSAVEAEHPRVLALGMTEREVIAVAGRPDAQSVEEDTDSECLWYGDSYLTFTNRKLTGWRLGCSPLRIPEDPYTHSLSQYAVIVRGTPDETGAAPSPRADLSTSAPLPSDQYVRPYASFPSGDFSPSSAPSDQYVSPYASSLSGGLSRSSAPRYQYVHGYTRKNGTQVQGYYRQAP